VGVVGTGEGEFALDACDDVVGEGLRVQNRNGGLGDEEEAVLGW